MAAAERRRHCVEGRAEARVEKLYCAPGNAGIAEVAECVNIGVMEFDKLMSFAEGA